MMEKRGAVLQLFRIMHDCSVSQFGMEGLTKSLENVKSTEGKIITISKKLLFELKRGLFITFCTEIHTSKRRTNLRRLFFSAEKLVEKTTKTCDKNALIIHTNVMNFVCI